MIDRDPLPPRACLKAPWVRILDPPPVSKAQILQPSFTTNLIANFQVVLLTSSHSDPVMR